MMFGITAVISVSAVLALVVGIILMESFSREKRKAGLICSFTAIVLLFALIPCVLVQESKPKTYNITKIVCYESYYEEQLIKVTAESRNKRGEYFYLYLTPKQFNEYKVKGENTLKISDTDFKALAKSTGSY